MTLQAGDIVMVIGTHHPRQPKPGAVGCVEFVCDCMFADHLEGYFVRFDQERAICYFRRHLKKLDPPSETESEIESTEHPVMA